MIIIFFSIILLIWIIIYPGTDYFTRYLDLRVIKKGKKDQSGRLKIALTFDDGPDPLYTPQLLEILNQFNIKATFFLVGVKAEQNPELVARILAAGHEIGLHTYRHHHAYLMDVSHSLESVYLGKATLEKLLKKPIVWLRPPWGALNLWQRYALKKLGLKIVLWSVNAKDWKLSTGSKKIISHLKQQVSNHDIIVLHDSGGELNAPVEMLQALPEVIISLQKAGFRFLTLSEIQGDEND